MKTTTKLTAAALTIALTIVGCTTDACNTAVDCGEGKTCSAGTCVSVGVIFNGATPNSGGGMGIVPNQPDAGTTGGGSFDASINPQQDLVLHEGDTVTVAGEDGSMPEPDATTPGPDMEEPGPDTSMPGSDVIAPECITAVDCTDNDVCNGVEGCNTETGKCVPGTPLDCDDGELCTTDTCHNFKGCLYEPNKVECDDGDACTTADVCSNGICAGAPLKCNDGDACNGVETCDSNSGCVAGEPLVCPDDGLECNGSEYCDAKKGCTFSKPPEGCCEKDADCRLDNNQAAGWACVKGTCYEGFIYRDCDNFDYDPCTDNKVNEFGNCTSTPVDLNKSPECAESLCIGFDNSSCDDGDKSTYHGCNPNTGQCMEVLLECTSPPNECFESPGKPSGSWCTYTKSPDYPDCTPE